MRISSLSDFSKQLNVRSRDFTTANMIASENRQSHFVRSLLSSDSSCRYFFSGKDGLRAFPGGNNWKVFQEAGEESLRRLGRAEYCNLRPLSGLHAMTVAILALTEPGDTVLSLSPIFGGHYATGNLSKRLGRRSTYFNLLDNGWLDESSLLNAIELQRPRLVYIDQCHGLRPIDIAAIVRLVRTVSSDALIHADVSHGLGLVLGGVILNPLDSGCDSYGGSTHKTFPGPQKGVLLTNCKKISSMFEAAQFDTISNHHLSESVALSAALLEFEELAGFQYASTIQLNSKAFASSLEDHGIPPVKKDGLHSEWHQIWISHDALPFGAMQASAALEEAGILVNLLSDLPQVSPWGLRLGVSELTHLGFQPRDMENLATLFAEVIQSNSSNSIIRRRIREMVDDAPRPFDYVERTYDGSSIGQAVVPWRQPTASQLLPVMVRGHGCYVEDSKGQRWLSAKSGALNAVLGFGREDAARTSFLQALALHSNDATSEINLPSIKLASRISAWTDEKLTHTLFCNSGSEAVEAAAKLALLASRSRGKDKSHKLVSFSGGYHGCTAAAASLAGIEFPKSGFNSLHSSIGYEYPFPRSLSDLKLLENDLKGKLRGEVFGIIIEPIQGIGGMRPVCINVMKELRRLCDSNDLLLIFDEVFSGFGRTGRRFAYNHSGVTPDILVASKGLAAGYSVISCVSMSPNVYEAVIEADEFGAIRHGHTMSGNAFACSVANYVLDCIEREELIQNAREQGSLIMRGLRQAIPEGSANVRGYGLMIGIDFGNEDIASNIVEECKEDFVLLRSQNGVVQITPPMTIGPHATEELVKALIRAFNKVKEQYSGLC